MSNSFPSWFIMEGNPLSSLHFMSCLALFFYQTRIFVIDDFFSSYLKFKDIASTDCYTFCNTFLMARVALRPHGSFPQPEFIFLLCTMICLCLSVSVSVSFSFILSLSLSHSLTLHTNCLSVRLSLLVVTPCFIFSLAFLLSNFP